MPVTHHIIKASILALLAFFCMAVFGILTKLACQQTDDIWVSFLTYSIATIGTALFILPSGTSALKSEHYFYLTARATIGTTASFLYMVSLHYISTVNATLLFNTAPIFIPIISYLLLKQEVSKNIWFAVVIGFIGILVIIKPRRDLLDDPGNLIALLSGIALAIAYLFMKTLTATDTGLRIIFYYFCIGTIMQIPLLAFAIDPPSANSLIYILSCGIALMLAQIFLVTAYRYASASEVGVYQYTSVVFVGIMAWLFWNKVPDSLDYLGFLLVTIAGVIIIKSGKSQKQLTTA